MSRFPLDDATAERLLTGRLSPEDAPPGFAGLAGLVWAATGPADPAELASESQVVSAAVAAVHSASSNRPITRRRTSMLAKLLSAKVAAVAVTSAIGAAAAAGTLPNSAQNAVSSALSNIGISVPDSSGNAKETAHDRSDGHIQNSQVLADFRKCTAFLSGPSVSARTDGASHDDGSDLSASTAAHGGSVQSTTAYCRAVVATVKQTAERTSNDLSSAAQRAKSKMKSPSLQGNGNTAAGADAGNGVANAKGNGVATVDVNGNGAQATIGGQVVGAPGQPKNPPPSVPEPNAKADFGQCTAFLAGQSASGGVRGGIGAGKASASPYAELITKHGGTVQSTSIYCEGVVAVH
jgi:hypothetical protein